ncbi:MAG TPA: nitroreductase family deazaflavin-dependent oxidoreductase [Acidimicrobiia bacterium]|jgi:deazaflavin-dependent oxidoreductase (nitroreductase family)|nr:nitroreductase family deazaflavin-dependent oxidoreductase [Acidimicrobiia bacterium]HIL47250.1 nitroreductase family deazaflavin-dependent oxidoreductase [Acidimicrobiia bacterium]
MPSDRSLKTMNSIHRGLIKVTGGKAGWTTGKMPVLKLTTIGRHSGQPRTVMLTSPIQEGDTMVVVASKGGADTHPAWFHNLKENPKVQVATQDADEHPMMAEIVSPEERARLWPLITEKYSGYAGYQEKTDREIPLIALRPLA